MSDTTILTPSLRSRLQAVARRVRRLRIIRGLSLIALVLLPTAATVMLIDHFVWLPGLLRLGLLLGWFVLGAAMMLVGLVLPLFRRLDAADLAAVIEKRYPELAERLTTSVELANTTDEFHGSPALIALLVSDTAQRTSRLDFLPAISANGAVALGAAALAVFVVALSPAAVWPREYATVGQRFFLAWNPSTWPAPKKAAPYDLDVPTKDILTARGRPVTFSVRVLPKHDNVLLPTRSTLVLIDDNGQETRLAMTVDRRDVFTLDHAVTRDGHYRIEAGDAVSQTYNIQAIVPVELAEDSPAVTVTAPSYSRQTIPDDHFTGLVDLSALQHSEVKFDFRFTRPAVAAFAELTTSETKEAADGAKTQSTKTLPLTLAEDRCSATLVLPADATGSYRIVLEAEHGIRTELDARTLTVRVDQPPQVVRFIGKEELQAILPYERLPLEITAGDDIGVARADLEFRVNDEEVRSEAMTLLGANRQEATAKHVFQLAAKVKEGDEINYRIRIQDNYPAEYGGAHTIYYPVDRWLKVKVAKQAAPLREQEIIAQRDDINKRLDTLKADLLREQRGAYKVRQESRNTPELAAEQKENLKQVQQENRANENALRELAREADASPALERIAEQARDVADREMRQSDAALQNAADKKKVAPQRDNEFQAADKALTAALDKLEAMKKANAKLAQERLDQLKVELLADREKQLAERAAELAAKDAVRDPTARQELEQIKREQAEVAAELQRLTEHSEALRQALDQARAEDAKKLSARAEELAEAQRDLAKAMKETKSDQPAPQGHQENPLGELAKQQAEIARQAAELAKNVGQDQGEKAPTTQQAQKAEQAAKQAANKLQAGATPEAQKSGKETADMLRRLAQDLAQTPRGNGDPKAPDPVQQARQLAQKQEELNRKLNPLASDKDAQRAQQAARQQELEKESNQLANELSKLGQQMNRTPQAANSAQQAANAAQQARQAMQQAREQQRQGKQPAAEQSQQNAAQALDRAAQQAAQASQQPGNQPSQDPQTGQAVQQAQQRLGEAQNKLNSGQPQGAQTAMRQAAQSMQDAARQMASQQSGRPNPMTRPGEFGATSGGLPDPSILGPDAQKYAGKTWGELPGELRTKIVQDMKARYGDDYARMIKLYFEQLADTNKK